MLHLPIPTEEKNMLTICTPPFCCQNGAATRGLYHIFPENPCKSLIFHVNSIEEITASNDDFYGVWITFIYYFQISVNII